MTLLLALAACDYERMITRAPADGEESGGPLQLKKIAVRERVPILPGTISWPPPAEPGIRSGQCGDLNDGGPISGDGCLTGTIGCNETIIGHTGGGVQLYDSKFYEKHFCTPLLTNHDGGDERIYRLDVPDGDHIAVVTLDTPCADLDLAGFKWQGNTCPSPDTLFHYCEMYPKDGHERETVRLVSQSKTSWFIVVEGKNNEEGAFSLTTQCRKGLF